MKLGVLGDIHSNLSALQTAIRLLEGRGVNHFVSVGDVVGYGAAPAECIELLRDLGAVVVKGNHDAACVEEVDDRCFNQAAREAVRWTRSVLDEDELDWLRGLPMTHEGDGFQVAHGTPFRPEEYNYFLNLGDAPPSLDCMTRPVAFVGHSHIPVSVLRLAECPKRLAYSPDLLVDLRGAQQALVNVGSVGQPRDEDPRLAAGFYDTETRQLEILRAEYDVERESARIRMAGLPSMLADRLHLGV
jgi:predicted phosphodiesterase